MSMNRLAGAGFQLSERVILDLGYRFIDMGKAQSETSSSSGFTNNPPVRVDDLTAHEFKMGLRFHFGGCARWPGGCRSPGPGRAPGLVPSAAGPIRLDLTGPPPIYVPPTL